MIIERAGTPLLLKFNGFGYVWEGSSIPNELKGLWTSKPEAEMAARGYKKQLEEKAERKKEIINWERTPLEELNLLSRKADLLDFAMGSGINVPEDKKSPAAIKSFIKKTLEKADA